MAEPIPAELWNELQRLAPGPQTWLS